MQVMDDTKSQTFVWPLIALVICFFLIILSINEIIEMAKPNLTISVSSNDNLQKVKDLIQNPQPLDYKTTSELFASHPDLHIDPKIENLPSSDQNYIIRLSLVEWELSQLQKQLSQVYSEPLIFKIWFWICSLFLSAISIFAGKIINFYTDLLIQKYCARAK